MATVTDSGVTEEDILEDEDVETTEVEDEISEEEVEEEVEAEEETVDEEQFEKRFTQFKGETPEEYLKNLEDAYGNSSTEATRLAQQAKDLQQQIDQVRTLVANNPDFAAQIAGTAPQGGAAPVLSSPTSPLADPALFYARQQMETKMEEDYKEFVSDHREMETDPGLAKQVTEYLSVLSQTNLQKTGKMLGMAEGLRAAWVMAGKSLTDNEEDTRMAVKASAGQSKSSVGRPSAPAEKPRFTKAQMDFAKRSWPDKTNEELVDMLGQYAQ